MSGTQVPTSLEAVDLHLQVVQSRVSPVVPSDTLNGGVCERSGEESASHPAVGKPLSSDAGDGGRDIGLEPGRAGSDGAAVGAA